MDNMKTGMFIKQLRREQNMTQRELAEQLHITDRAVSKWERGLSAPDIGLLEPLANILGVSVLEILEGYRENVDNRNREEDCARKVLRYSGQEITRKLKRTRKVYATGLFLCLAAVLVAGVFFAHSGRLFVLARIPSPDKTAEATVYRKVLKSGGFSMKDGTSLIVDKGNGEGSWRVTYGDAEYRGLWWAPDGRKYVLALQDGEKLRLALAWLDKNSESNLNAYLSMGVESTELKKYGYANQRLWPEIEYQFLQWSADSTAMLIYYTFPDAKQLLHEGYFWYNCETGQVSAILELEAE